MIYKTHQFINSWVAGPLHLRLSGMSGWIQKEYRFQSLALPVCLVPILCLPLLTYLVIWWIPNDKENVCLPICPPQMLMPCLSCNCESRWLDLKIFMRSAKSWSWGHLACILHLLWSQNWPKAHFPKPTRRVTVISLSRKVQGWKQQRERLIVLQELHSHFSGAE